MRTIDLRKQERLVRVRDFGAAHRDVFPASSQAGKLFAAVATAVEALEQKLPVHAGLGASRGGAGAKAAAREALRRRLATIATMARALALDVPGFDDNFRIPPTCADARLLVIARSFARDARPLARQFISHDMPADFLVSLGREIDAFAAATSLMTAGLDTRRATRAGIDATHDKAGRVVTQLNAIVRARLQDDRAVLAAWNNARRLDASARAKKDGPAGPSPAVGPSTGSKSADTGPVAAPSVQAALV
jgi:hypothetical protein